MVKYYIGKNGKTIFIRVKGRKSVLKDYFAVMSKNSDVEEVDYQTYKAARDAFTDSGAMELELTE